MAPSSSSMRWNALLLLIVVFEGYVLDFGVKRVGKINEALKKKFVN